MKIDDTYYSNQNVAKSILFNFYTYLQQGVKGAFLKKKNYLRVYRIQNLNL